MDAFLVKVWRSDETDERGLRGTVEHVRTNRSIVFRDADDLVGFLEDGRLEKADEGPDP